MARRQRDPHRNGRTAVGDLVSALYEAAGAVRQQGEQLARGGGQSLARWEVLYILGEAAGSTAQVGRRLGRTRQSVQRVVDLLHADGLIAARDNPDHARSPMFELTLSGRDVLNALNTSAVAWHRLVQAAFSAEELRGLQAALQRLTAVAREWPQSGARRLGRPSK